MSFAMKKPGYFLRYQTLIWVVAALLGCDADSLSPLSKADANVNNPSGGIGGSMARFAVVGNYLYTVGDTDLTVFDISNASNPVQGERIKLGFGIETIYPYGSNLFIGSRAGMKIYDNTNPRNPVFLSEYVHIQACDPVVVQGRYAYVTLRNGTTCRNGANLLDVVDISDLKNPKVVNSILMTNPHGLGVDGKDLFVGEGDFGLKVFDLTDPTMPKLTQVLESVKTFDVIPLRSKTLVVVGNDGLYQFDYTNRTALQRLSKIDVQP